MLWLDDGFTRNPKIILVGFDAAWLYLDALCWARRYKTGGIIPKAMLSQLSCPKVNRGPLVKRLTTIPLGYDHPLWHDRGDHWEINDYEAQNVWEEGEKARQRARSEQASNAARARWASKEQCSSNAPAHAPASDEHMLQHMPEQCQRAGDHAYAPATPAPARDRVPIPNPLVVSNSSSTTGLGCGSMKSDEDELLEDLWAHLARADLEGSVERGQEPRYRQAWLDRCAANRKAQHEPSAREWISRRPSLVGSRDVATLAALVTKGDDGQDRAQRSIAANEALVAQAKLERATVDAQRAAGKRPVLVHLLQPQEAS